MSDRRQYHGEFPDGEPRDRGVSEVISFALIFSLIIATVALVYVSGIGGLEDTRSAEQVNNAERAFDVLADNIGDIHRQAAPSRATEIKVSDAQMEFGDPVRVNVTIQNKLGENASVIEYQPIVYSAESGTDLLYSNGALFREDRGGATMDKPPSFLLTFDEGPDGTVGTTDDEKTLILPVIETRNVGAQSTGSQRTVLVRTLLATREVTIAEDDPSELEVNPDTSDGSDEYTTAQLNPDRIGDGSNADEREYNVSIRVQTSPERQELWLDYLNGLVEEQPDAAGFDAHDAADDYPGEPAGDTDPSNDPACTVIDVDGESTIQCHFAAESVYSTATRIDVIYR